MKLKWEEGEEAICPNCQHRNAMLNTGWIGEVAFLECRDCHLIVAYKAGAKRLTGLVDGRVIMRSLGKNCSRCGSFNLKEERPGSYIFKCQDCSAPAVKY